MNESRHINIPIFIPHRGCPHTCVFCDQKRISGVRQHQSIDDVRQLLDESLSTTCDDDNIEIAFFGGSFTGIPEKEMLSYLDLARPYIERKKVQGIRLSTRPDYINDHIMDILLSHGVTAIELGVQSLDDEVLKNSQRGHTAEDVKKACALVKASGIKLGIQTMLGLPCDSLEKALKTAHEVLELKPDMVRIYPVLVLQGTFLETLYQDGRYAPLSLDEAVEWCAKILPLYREAGIKVLRIGLQASESLEGSIIAGPFHPAFGELVESRILYMKLTKQLDTLQPLEHEKIIIRTRPDMVSKLVGQKRSNMDAVKKKYSLDEITVRPDLTVGDFEVLRLNS